MKDVGLISLDQAYSTTRQLTRDRPALDQRDNSSVQTVLCLPESKNRMGEGGLRTEGYFKQSIKSSPLVTVITVVFNGEAILEQTILSVINQSYDNIEYIIVDGGSSDKTLDIINKYQHLIDYWVSENDKGIYDAMNKGLRLASGDWVNFMNGGDLFFQTDTVDAVFKGQDYSSYQIIYGNQQVRYPSGKTRNIQAGNISNIAKHSQFCHQAAFIKAEFHKANRYNIDTKIVADFEFFYLAWKNQASYKQLDQTICSFDAGGASDGNTMEVFWEMAAVKNRLGISGKISAYSEALYAKLKWSIRKLIWN